MRIMLVDPSTHGGIASYSFLLARALHAAGAHGQLVMTRRPGTAPGFRNRQWLPTVRWGRPPDAGLGFYVTRAAEWTLSASAVAAGALVFTPDVVHFQAPLNRRMDPALLRLLRRHRAVVWTAHDVLPPEPTKGDTSRFAAIYRAVDVVIVHGERAAAEVTRVSGVDPVIIAYPAPPDVPRTDRAEARRRLRLPAEGRILAATPGTGPSGPVVAYDGAPRLRQ